MARMEATRATQQVRQPKRGVFRLFRRGSRPKAAAPDKRDRTPSPKNIAGEVAVREEIPEMHPEAATVPTVPPTRTSDAKTTEQRKESSSATRSAFTGPPKYSWVDIVRTS